VEVAGTVVQLGANCDSFEIGARVMGIVGGGGYAEYARVDSQMAVLVPQTMTFVDAAATMESFVTAFEAVSHLAGVKEDSSILIHGAAGGVGSACVQTAVALRANVYGAASTLRAADVVRLGAVDVFDYARDDFEQKIKEATNGVGVDAIIDFVGGDYLAANIRSLKEGGSLVQVGLMSNKTDASITLDVLLYNHLKFISTVMKSRTIDEKRAMVARFRKHLLPLFESGALRPIIKGVFPLALAAEAHRKMQAGGGFGKIVLWT
jgi:NADPH2:quinone reductase